MFIANVIGYETEGVDLIVSCSTLAGATFQSRVCRGASVQDLAQAMHESHSETKFGFGFKFGINGFKKRVAVIGPKGTSLNLEMPLPEALDHEPIAPVECEEGDFYSLSVLRGDAWRELGLQAATRWQYLRESEFQKVFGLSKATFEQMPSWKQIPLKKRHGLF